MVPRNNNTNRGVKGRKKRNGRNGGEGSEEAQVEADVRARHATAVRHDSRLPPSFSRFDIFEESRNRPTTTTDYPGIYSTNRDDLFRCIRSWHDIYPRFLVL